MPVGCIGKSWGLRGARPAGGSHGRPEAVSHALWGPFALRLAGGHLFRGGPGLFARGCDGEWIDEPEVWEAPEIEIDRMNLGIKAQRDSGDLGVGREVAGRACLFEQPERAKHVIDEYFMESHVPPCQP
jgi:hypothetical protein